MMSRIAPPLALLLLGGLVGCSTTTTVDAQPAPSPEGGSADAASPSADASDAGTAPDAAPSSTLAPMSTARSLFATVNGKDGRIRSFEGLSSKGLDDSAEAYDPATNTWTVAAGRSSVRRYGLGATADAEGNVYVIGGTSDGASPIGDVELFSPKDGSFTALAPLPTPRLGLAAATAKDGRVYAIGGRDASGAPSDVVEIYSPVTKAWTAGPSLTTKRLSLVAVTGVDGKIYALGGRDAQTAPLAVVEALDPTPAGDGTWTTVQPMKSARYWFGATLGADGRIYALGGIDAFGFVDAVEAFTPSAGWVDLPSMPEPRAWVSAAATSDGRVFAIGGSTTSDDAPTQQPPPVRTMLALDPKTGRWTK